MELETVSSSKWLQPWRLKYKQDGVAKDWDMLQSNGSVVSVVYNESSDSLVMVKQFRPAVLVCKALRDSQGSSQLSGITLNHFKNSTCPRSKSRIGYCRYNCQICNPSSSFQPSHENRLVKTIPTIRQPICEVRFLFIGIWSWISLNLQEAKFENIGGKIVIFALKILKTSCIFMFRFEITELGISKTFFRQKNLSLDCIDFRKIW